MCVYLRVRIYLYGTQVRARVRQLAVNLPNNTNGYFVYIPRLGQEIYGRAARHA